MSKLDPITKALAPLGLPRERVYRRGTDMLLVNSDCRAVAAAMPECCIDSIVCDPQFGRFAANPELSFGWMDAAVLAQKIRGQAEAQA